MLSETLKEDTKNGCISMFIYWKTQYRNYVDSANIALQI